MINEYNQPTPMPDTFGDRTDAAPSNDDVISTLNGLIETCRDGQEGFKQAAEGVERADLKTLFYEFGQQRATFVGELQDVVRTLGGDPENSGSFAGTLHRGWINIKSVVTGKDEEAILNECERGEDAAKKAYKDALDTALPAYVAQTVQDQYTSVQSAHDRVRDLRDTFHHDNSDDKSTTARTGA
jgi:uncharacterized protein (TIGR02284 family)